MFDEKTSGNEEVFGEYAGMIVDPPDPTIRKELGTIENGLFQSAKNNWSMATISLELALTRSGEEYTQSVRENPPKKYEDYLKEQLGDGAEYCIKNSDRDKITKHDQYVDQYNLTVGQEPPDLNALKNIIDQAIALFG